MRVCDVMIRVSESTRFDAMVGVSEKTRLRGMVWVLDYVVSCDGFDVRDVVSCYRCDVRELAASCYGVIDCAVSCYSYEIREYGVSSALACQSSCEFTNKRCPPIVLSRRGSAHLPDIHLLIIRAELVCFARIVWSDWVADSEFVC